MLFERRRPGHFRRSSALRALKDAHEFRDLPALLGAIASGDRVLDAMGDVVAQEFFLHAAKSSTGCGNLRNDVDAISILLNHPSEAADLAFDPVEPLETRLLVVLAHRTYHIPIQGIRFKAIKVK